ncbi:NADH-ubiquinone oxidoreductase 19 kDa subunit, partial [Trichostrongylus colubriformis]
MALTKDMKLPSDEELTVPQEITLSTPWLKAVAPYMAKHCEDQINEFMLRRKELQDPRATLKEGAAVTACGVDFLRSLKKTCAKETETLANCVDQSSARLFMSKCHDQQKVLDACIEEKLQITRPKMGYFSKLHVYDSKHPAPEPKVRDYKAEAAKVLKELPEDYHLRKDYRNDENYFCNKDYGWSPLVQVTLFLWIYKHTFLSGSIMESFLKSWKAVSWENVQLRVDGEIKAIGQRQDEGEVGRKILVDESNKYRENTTKVIFEDFLSFMLK